MTTPYTLLPAYSGPLRIPSPVQDMSIDTYGLAEFQFTVTSDLFPASLRGNLCRITLPAGATEWIPISTLPTGTYGLRYVSGAMSTYGEGYGPDDKWNEGWSGPSNTGTGRPWVRSAQDDEEVWAFPDPAFTLPGYPTQESAEAAAKGVELPFFHSGGVIEVRYDLDPVEGVGEGAVVLDLFADPTDTTDGYWEVTWSSATSPPQIDPKYVKAEFPRLLGVTPGLHLVRFIANYGTESQTWQNFWIWSWVTQPRKSAAAQASFTPVMADTLLVQRYQTSGFSAQLPWNLFPVRPAAPHTQGLLNRRYLEQAPQTSGVRTELPVTTGNLRVEPAKRGQNESF